jgi:hypothetical protein
MCKNKANLDGPDKAVNLHIQFLYIGKNIKKASGVIPEAFYARKVSLKLNCFGQIFRH